MIVSFKHRGLRALYRGRGVRHVAPAHVRKMRDILAVLDQSRGPQDVNLLGFRLHRLKGALRNHYAVSVSGNLRVTFRCENGHAVDVDYTDYH